jgi:hypothetical protein
MYYRIQDTGFLEVENERPYPFAIKFCLPKCDYTVDYRTWNKKNKHKII